MRNGKKNSSSYCSFLLWRPMNLTISKENLITILWRLLLQHSKNHSISPFISYLISLYYFRNPDAPRDMKLVILNWDGSEISLMKSTDPYLQSRKILFLDYMYGDIVIFKFYSKQYWLLNICSFLLLITISGIWGN